MQLRNGKELRNCKPIGHCDHPCDCATNHECCECGDSRPKQNKYIAFKYPDLRNYKEVTRDYYYCPTCKKNNNNYKHLKEHRK